MLPESFSRCGQIGLYLQAIAAFIANGLHWVQASLKFLLLRSWGILKDQVFSGSIKKIHFGNMNITAHRDQHLCFIHC